MEEIIYNLIKQSYEYKMDWKIQESINKLKSALSFDLSNGNLWKSYWDLIQQENTAKALELYNRAIICENEDSKFRAETSALLLDINYIDDALKAINRAIQLEEIAEYYSLRSCIYMMKNDTENAIKDLKTAISLDENDPLFYANLWTILKDLWDVNNALLFFYKTIEINKELIWTEKEISWNDLQWLNDLIKECLNVDN